MYHSQTDHFKLLVSTAVMQLSYFVSPYKSEVSNRFTSLDRICRETFDFGRNSEERLYLGTYTYCSNIDDSC